jgi:hypothetical protein
VDLLDRHRGLLSSRRLAVLVKHLPRDSAVNRDLYGEAAEWSVTDHLLAAVVDHLAAANWMFACVNSDDESGQPDPPIPVPRPGDDRLDGHGRDPYGNPDRGPDDRTSIPAADVARFFS